MASLLETTQNCYIFWKFQGLKPRPLDHPQKFHVDFNWPLENPLAISSWKFHIIHPSSLLQLDSPSQWLVSRFRAWCESDSLTVTVTACSDIPQSLKSLFILLLSSRFMDHSLPNLLPTFIFQHFTACGEELIAPLSKLASYLKLDN